MTVTQAMAESREMPAAKTQPPGRTTRMASPPGTQAVTTIDQVVQRPVRGPDGPDGRTGIAIDFGSREVLDHLAAMGIDRITHVLLTHHHRDQAQGLPRAAEAGVQIVVPPVEQDLVGRVDELWERRQVVNDYNLREDRFSILEPVPIAGLAQEYRTTTSTSTATGSGSRTSARAPRCTRGCGPS